MLLSFFSNLTFELNGTIALTCLGIITARMADVGMGTLRTKQVAMGRRGTASILGFFEVLIWVAAVSSVVTNLNNPWLALSYALGHALGVFVGLTIDRRLGLGHQVIRIFTRDGSKTANQLRDEGYRVTEFTGRGRDGEVQLLYIEVSRRQMGSLAKRARELDEQCFYIVEDVNQASRRHQAVPTDTGITSVFKKK